MEAGKGDSLHPEEAAHEEGNAKGVHEMHILVIANAQKMSVVEAPRVNRHKCTGKMHEDSHLKQNQYGPVEGVMTKSPPDKEDAPQDDSGVNEELLYVSGSPKGNETGVVAEDTQDNEEKCVDPGEYVDVPDGGFQLTTISPSRRAI